MHARSATSWRGCRASATCIMFGQRDYSMRIWLDPDKLAAAEHDGRRRGPGASASRTSRSPPARSASRRPPTGQQTPDHAEHARPAGRRRAVRERSSSRRRPTAGSSGSRTSAGSSSGAKNQDVSSQRRRQARRRPGHLPAARRQRAGRRPTSSRPRWRSCKKDFPEGVDYEIRYDTTPFIRESISEVFKTLRDAIILVALVVLVFLQNWRSALIPLIAVPVAIIGTFAVMAAFGLQPQQPDAVRPGAGDRHRGRRRDRRGRGGRASHRARAWRRGTRRSRRWSEVSGPVIAVGLVLSRGVRPVCVHHGHHRPVLPPVRADDRRLDGHLDVQLADAQPGPRGPAACGRGRRGLTRRCPGWRSWGWAPGKAIVWLGPLLLPLVKSSGLMGHVTTASVLPDLGRSFASDPALAAGLAGGFLGGLAGWAVSRPLNRRLGWFFDLFNRGFTATASALFPASSAGCCGSSCWCFLVYGGLLVLTYWRVREHAAGLHPVAGHGLPAGERPASRLGVAGADPER